MDKFGKDDDLIPQGDYEYEKQLAQQERQSQREKQDAYEAALEAEQQRKKEAEKARQKRLAQEKVELMKLKSGVIEESETIKEEHDEIRQVKGFEKVTNFWYHNKLMIIFVAFLVVVFGYVIYDTVTREKADITVMMIANNDLSLRQDELEEFFEKYTDDFNGDGKVHVDVYIMPLKQGSSDQMYATNSSKFLALLQSSENIITIIDSNTDPYYLDIFKSDLNEDFPDNPYIDECGLSMNMKLLADELKFEYMPNDMHIAMRIPMKTVEDSLEDMEKSYEQSSKVFSKIVEDLTARAVESNDPGLKTEPVKLETNVPQEDNTYTVRAYGDPKDADNFWSIDDKGEVEKVDTLIKDNLTEQTKVENYDGSKVNKGAESYTLTDSDNNTLVIRNVTGKEYNISYNNDEYYEISQEKLDEILEIVIKK